jgi:hypothetical protein
MISAKLRVFAGGSDQRSGGDASGLSQVCLAGICPPEVNAALYSSKAIADPPPTPTTAMRTGPTHQRRGVHGLTAHPTIYANWRRMATRRAARRSGLPKISG